MHGILQITRYWWAKYHFYGNLGKFMICKKVISHTLPELVQCSNCQLNIIKKIALDSDRIFNCIVSERYFLPNVKAVSMADQKL